jgi:hypothetical protein
VRHVAVQLLAKSTAPFVVHLDDHGLLDMQPNGLKNTTSKQHILNDLYRRNELRFRHGQGYTFLHPTDGKNDSVTQEHRSSTYTSASLRVRGVLRIAAPGNDEAIRTVGAIPKDTWLDTIAKLRSLTNVVHKSIQSLQMPGRRSCHKSRQLTSAIEDFMTTPTSLHLKRLYRLMNCVRQTAKLRNYIKPCVFWDGSDCTNGFINSGRSDAEYASDPETCRSVSGGTVFLSDTVIFAVSRMQK